MEKEAAPFRSPWCVACLSWLFPINRLCLLQVQVQRPRQRVLRGGAGEVALRLPAPYSGGRLPDVSPFLPGQTLGQGDRGLRQRVPEWVSASWPAVTRACKPQQQMPTTRLSSSIRKHQNSRRWFLKLWSAVRFKSCCVTEAGKKK